jgi:hypothetical protein
MSFKEKSITEESEFAPKISAEDEQIQCEGGDKKEEREKEPEVASRDNKKDEK